MHFLLECVHYVSHLKNPKSLRTAEENLGETFVAKSILVDQGLNLKKALAGYFS